MKKWLNYVGQLRIYSLVDLVVFATALTRNPHYIAGITLLWVSFLLYLEAQHQDRLRLKVRNIFWVIVYLPTFFLLPLQVPILFAALSIVYTLKKKHPFFGLTSPVWRGLQNFSLAWFISPTLAAPALFLITVRNLIGDFRDTGDDRENNQTTIPIALGFKKNQQWAFYAHMLMVPLTTYFWLTHSFVSLGLLPVFIVAEVLSYPLTPRSSNPKYLNIYR